LLVREPMSEHNASPSSHAFLVDIGHHQLKNPILRQSLDILQIFHSDFKGVVPAGFRGRGGRRND